MSSAYPEVYLVRHGQTEWSLSGRHTGRTDIPLTAAGEEAARKLAGRLPSINFAAVWSSPSQRAQNTCALAGFGDRRVVKDDLAEWDYGAYEGITTKAILAERPGWQVFRDGCPNGEMAAVFRDGEGEARSFDVSPLDRDGEIPGRLCVREIDLERAQNAAAVCAG